MATWKKLLHESSPASDFPTLNQSTTGSAATLTNGRTLTVDLTSTSASTAFDGSAAITDIGVSGTLATGSGGTGLTGFTAGDILYASNTSTIAKLGIGSDGQVLTLASGVPSWADASSGDVTGIDAGTGITIGDASTATPSVSVKAAQTGITSIYNTSLAIGAGSDKGRMTFGTTDIHFGADATNLTLVLENADANNNVDNLRPKSDRGVNLGTSSYKYNEAHFRTAVATDAIIGTIKLGTAASNTALTASATELNYVDGVTSAIQTQLDGKAGINGDSGENFSAANMTVAGNLTVSGTSTIQNSTVETVNISDVQIKLGAGLSGSSRDLAIVFDRGGANAVAEGVVTTNGLDAALFYDSTTGFLSMAGVPTDLNEGDDVPDNIDGVTGVENIKQVLLGSSSTSAGSGDQAPIGSIHIDTDDNSGTPYIRLA